MSPENTPKVSPPATVIGPAPAVLDACALLSSAEIHAIQGEPLQEATPQRVAQNGLVISQCSFALPTAANSISLQIQQRAQGSDGRDVKRVWHEIFAADGPLVSGSRKSGAAKKIEDLGDQAYWVGNDALGALSMLKGERYITISVGGAGDQAAKRDKCIAFARLIVARL